MSSRKRVTDVAGTAGFVGFAAFAGPAAPEAPPAAPPAGAISADAFYGGADGELRQVLKRLSKRDAVTRVKALQDLSALIPTRDKAVLRDFLPAWVNVYCNLVVHNDRRLRLGAQQVFKELVSGGG